jgi:ATP-binding cassette subfamily C protein CydCD
MLQDVHLLRATIGENIAYGGLNGVEHSRQQLEAAAQEARLSDDLRHLSGGIDFRVGDEGANLSGGQRRRIALARLFLRNPALMLLDEPLEGVARGDRQKILEAILAKRSRSTVVIATHDLDIIEAADRILLLERKPGSTGEGVTIGTFGRYQDFQETNEAFKGILGHSRRAREKSVTS